jgi:hypothetical protein
MRHGAYAFASTLLMLATACGGEPFSAGGADLDASTSRFPDTAPRPGEASADRAEAATRDGPSAEGPNGPVGVAVTNGLLLWLRADVGVTESSDGVSNWADGSGNHLDARQPDPTQEPLWLQSGVSSRPAVVFNAENFLSLPGGFADFSNGISMFVITAVTDAAVTCIDLVHLSNGPEVDDIALGLHDGRVHYEVLSGDLHGDLFPIGRAHLISVVHSPGRAVSLRIDAAAPTTSIFEMPASVTRLSNVIGRSLYADCGSLHGGLAEVLVYRRALNDFERSQVETYLQDRWGCCR